MQDKPEIRQSGGGKSSGFWIAAAWISFLTWLLHSFTVRTFFDSLHGAGKLWGGR